MWPHGTLSIRGGTDEAVLHQPVAARRLDRRMKGPRPATRLLRADGGIGPPCRPLCFYGFSGTLVVETGHAVIEKAREDEFPGLRKIALQDRVSMQSESRGSRCVNTENRQIASNCSSTGNRKSGVRSWPVGLYSRLCVFSRKNCKRGFLHMALQEIDQFTIHIDPDVAAHREALAQNGFRDIACHSPRPAGIHSRSSPVPDADASVPITLDRCLPRWSLAVAACVKRRSCSGTMSFVRCS